MTSSRRRSQIWRTAGASRAPSTAMMRSAKAWDTDACCLFTGAPLRCGMTFVCAWHLGLLYPTLWRLAPSFLVAGPAEPCASGRLAAARSRASRAGLSPPPAALLSAPGRDKRDPADAASARHPPRAGSIVAQPDPGKAGDAVDGDDNGSSQDQHG